MKITKQRLKEIIKEELTKYEWEALKFDDADGPFVLRMSGKGAEEAYFHGLGPGRSPRFGPREGAHEYTSIDKAMDRQSALKADGAGLAEVEPAGTLRLKGDPSQKEIDRLAYGARTGRWKDR
tara:strand:- start:65 stop:433 length:369 start_codon:yes stop_codon:yes gene_type:complete